MPVSHIRKFIIVLLTLFCIFASTVLVGSGAMTIGIMFIIFLLCIFSQSIFSLEYFIICTVFQNITLIICAPFINYEETMLIIILKEMVIYGICVVYFIKYKIKNLDLQDAMAIGFGIICLIQIAQASSKRLAIISLRQIVVAISCYYFGKGIKIRKEEEVKKVYDSICFWGVIVCLLGIALFFCSDQFWLKIGFEDYWYNKTNGKTSYNFINFYTYDLGIRMKRLVSIFAEPLSCAHFLGIGFITIFVSNVKTNAIMKKFIFSVALVLGLTKSSILVIVSVLLVTYYTKIKNKLFKSIFVFFCLLVSLGGLLILNDYASGLSQATSIGNHFNSFIYGLKNMSLLGNGLGTTGYNAKIMGLTDFDAGYGESFFSTCSAQVGLLGTIFLYGFIILGITKNFNIYCQTKNKYVLASIILLFEVLLESLFSASSVSMLGTGLYFTLAGLCSNESCFQTLK